MVNQIPFRTSKSETTGAGAFQRDQAHPSLRPFFAASLFSHTYKSLSPHTRSYRFSSSSLSCAYKSLNAQTLCFHIYANPRGVTQRIRQHRSGTLSSLPQIHFFHTVAASCGLLALFFAFVSFIFNHLQPLVPKTGGGVGGAGRASVRPFQITYSGVKTLEREQGITR